MMMIRGYYIITRSSLSNNVSFIVRDCNCVSVPHNLLLLLQAMVVALLLLTILLVALLLAIAACWYDTNTYLTLKRLITSFVNNT
jgi:hypothetical protein